MTDKKVALTAFSQWYNDKGHEHMRKPTADCILHALTDAPSGEEVQIDGDHAIEVLERLIPVKETSGEDVRENAVIETIQRRIDDARSNAERQYVSQGFADGFIHALEWAKVLMRHVQMKHADDMAAQSKADAVEVTEKEAVAIICQEANKANFKAQYETQYWQFAIQALQKRGVKIVGGG